jgi:hypothetical protein
MPLNDARHSFAASTATQTASPVQAKTARITGHEEAGPTNSRLPSFRTRPRAVGNGGIGQLFGWPSVRPTRGLGEKSPQRHLGVKRASVPRVGTVQGIAGTQAGQGPQELPELPVLLRKGFVLWGRRQMYETVIPRCGCCSPRIRDPLSRFAWFRDHLPLDGGARNRPVGSGPNDATDYSKGSLTGMPPAAMERSMAMHTSWVR